MREILFRAPHYFYNGRFSHFTYWGNIDHKGNFSSDSFSSPSTSNNTTREDSEQFTGLKDKNGKKIFEGDIRGGTYFCMDEECSFKEVIKWDNNSMYFYWDRIKGSKPDFMETEIIGNIHE